MNSDEIAVGSPLAFQNSELFGEVPVGTHTVAPKFIIHNS